jgi:hypothetical protein
VLQRLSYDAWGKQRQPDGHDVPPDGTINNTTTRDFTNQEELSVSGLVHLNGRIYDPLIGRMTRTAGRVSPTGPARWQAPA